MHIPEEYKGWRVYLYDAQAVNGRFHCPHCHEFPPSVSGHGNLMPPYACQTDKILFDACLDPKWWDQQKSTVHWMFRNGDLGSLLGKYQRMKELFAQAGGKPAR